MITYKCVYSNHGRHKRIAKFKSWFTLADWLEKNIKTEDLENYIIKKTKS